MAHIRTYQQLTKLRLTKAERHLVNTAQTGELCVLGDGLLPAADCKDKALRIRANVLRYLILGGCNKCVVNEMGVWLEGAYVTGNLDLNFTTTRGAIRIQKTHFDEKITLEHATTMRVNLNGSRMPGIAGEGLNVAGTLFIRKVTSSASIDLKSAEIGGRLSCTEAKITAESGYALNLQDAKIVGSIFLHPRVEDQQKKYETSFECIGGIQLSNASAGGFYAESTTITATGTNDAIRANNLTIDGDVRLGRAATATDTGSARGVMTGEVRFKGAQITGDLRIDGATFQNKDGHAFNGQRMKVTQSFVWKKVEIPSGKISLNGAHVGELDDDPEKWPTAGKLYLDGFTYDRIRGKVSTSPARKKWLLNGSLYKEQFFPQPYTQYAKFLRETGHDAQSRKVMLTRERMVRRYERKEFKPALRAWRWFWDGLQFAVVGHGHAPFVSIIWLVVLIAAAMVPAHMAWKEGSFAPNSAPILVAAEWNAIERIQDSPAAVWSGEVEPSNWRPQQFPGTWESIAPGRDWETFNSFAYAADIVIPLIDFGQTDAWAPSTTRGPWGWHLWWARWVFTVFGWIITALGAAAITGIIRRD